MSRIQNGTGLYEQPDYYNQFKSYQSMQSSFSRTSITELDPFKSLMGTEDITEHYPEIMQPSTFKTSPRWKHWVQLPGNPYHPRLKLIA